MLDYVAGKADWLAYGLPREGANLAVPNVGELARRDVPTCRLGDRLAEVQERVREAGWDVCIVVSDAGVVLGRLGRKALQAAAGEVEGAMTPGPSTIRPSVPLETVVKRLRDRDLTSALVTTSDGRLVGVLRLEDAERHLGDSAG